MIPIPLFRTKTSHRRCIYCKAFKPIPDSEDMGYCAYWKRTTMANDCCHKFKR